MRTTLNLDEDVLATARALAAHPCKSLGEVVSGLIRRAVAVPAREPVVRNGIPLLPVAGGARPVTPELVKHLLEEPE